MFNPLNADSRPEPSMWGSQGHRPGCCLAHDKPRPNRSRDPEVSGRRTVSAPRFRFSVCDAVKDKRV